MSLTDLHSLATPADHASLGHALAVVASVSAGELSAELVRLGYRPIAVDEPYAALIELLDRPMVYRAVVISLPALYRDELALIRTVRARLPHVDVLLAHTDGRHAALAEAMRLGATGLLSEDTIHRLAETQPMLEPVVTPTVRDVEHPAEFESEPEPDESIEPILTAEELRALLHEQPSMPEQS